MGPSIPGCGPKRNRDGSSTRFVTRPEFLENISAIVKQDIVDIMLLSAANLEALGQLEKMYGEGSGKNVMPKSNNKTFDSKPPANAANKGKQLIDRQTGEMFTSNGIQWVKQ
jgi:hypothetical protein